MDSKKRSLELNGRDTELPGSAVYRLAIRSSKVKDNPARLVKHRFEDNARIRFLSAEEEAGLRKAMEGRCPERVPEFALALHTGMRVSEQYGLTWADVSFSRRVLTIQRSKNGSARHVPLNQSALRSLETLSERTGGTGFVCGGAAGPRRWFEPILRDAKIARPNKTAGKRVPDAVPAKSRELLGHKTIAMTVRYSHLAPKHTLAAVEQLDAPSAESIATTTATERVGPSAGRTERLQ